MYELKNAKILVSGSTSKLLKGELSTLLTGRHLDIIVFPLSFREFLEFKDLKIENKLDTIVKEVEIKKYLKEYINFGGFPEVVLAKNEEIKKEILLTYFEDIIEKDVVERYKIRSKEKLKVLAKFYLSNISSPITFSSLKNFLNINTVSIENFSLYLEEAFLIFLLKFFIHLLSSKKGLQERFIV